MNRIHRIALVGILLTALIGIPGKGFCHSYDEYKVVIGMPFVFFDIEDIFNQRWVSTYLRGRPVVILTAHRYQRYEVLKWAELLKRDFGLPGTAHLLWVVNLSRFPWTTSRGTIMNQWRSFGPPIPLLLDWHGIIGKCLQINYNVPNIIALDSEGRLAMHEIHSFTPEVYAAVAARIQALVNAAPGMPMSPFGLGQVGTTGRRGYSN